MTIVYLVFFSQVAVDFTHTSCIVFNFYCVCHLQYCKKCSTDVIQTALHITNQRDELYFNCLSKTLTLMCTHY